MRERKRDITKKEFLENAIKHSHAFTKPRQEFLLANLDKFTEFVKVDPNEIYDYTDFSLVALHLLIKNGQEVEVLKTIDDITSYMNRKFENFCIAIAMGGKSNMYKIIEEIKELLDDKTLTSYRIGKETGISVQQVDRYRKTVKIENIPLKNALKLHEYYKKIKKFKKNYLQYTL